MKIFFILALIFYGVSAQIDTSYGLLVTYNKSELSKDFLYIINAIVQNTRNYGYPDINNVINHILYKEGRYIRDIEMSSLNYNDTSLIEKLRYNTINNTLVLQVNSPVLNYTFNFTWKVTIAGFNFAVGNGSFALSIKKLEANVFLSDGVFKGDLNTEFNYRLTELAGHRLNDNIKNYINQTLKEKYTTLMPQLMQRNKDFIVKYLFYQYRKAVSKYKEFEVAYENVPENWYEDDNTIIVGFKTNVKSKDKVLTTKDKLTPISNKKHKVGMVISPELIILTIKLHCALSDRNFNVDLKKLGYSGTIREFYAADSELRKKFSPDTKVNGKCTKSDILPDTNSLKFGMNIACMFIAKNTIILSGITKLQITTSIGKTDNPENLFIGNIKQCDTQVQSVLPPTLDAKNFFTPLVTKIGRTLFTTGPLEFPMIRYETLRQYTTMEIEYNDEGYKVFYD